MSASEIERTLVRLAHEIVEKNDGSRQPRASSASSAAASRWRSASAQLIEKIEKHPVDTGVLDISFYRDDLSTAAPAPPSPRATSASTSPAATSS